MKEIKGATLCKVRVYSLDYRVRILCKVWEGEVGRHDAEPECAKLVDTV